MKEWRERKDWMNRKNHAAIEVGKYWRNKTFGKKTKMITTQEKPGGGMHSGNR